MDYAKLLKNIWLFAASFFIGSCSIFGLNPFAVGYVIAVCLSDENVFLAYIGVAVGIALNMPAVMVIRYCLIIIAIVLLFQIKGLFALKRQHLSGALFAAAFFVIVNITVKLLVDIDISPEQIVLEGGVVFSTAIIYTHAIKIIKQDYVRIIYENEAAISVMAFFATILYGMPVKAYGGFIIAEAAALFSILFAMYKFGFGIGTTWTVIAGVIMSVVSGDFDYLTTWMIVTIAAFAIHCLIRGGRIAFTLVYAMIYYLCGAFFYETLLDESSIKAVVSALFVFLMAPNRAMLRVDDRVRQDELQENSPEWGRLIVNRVNALASAFKRIEYTLAGNVNTGIGLRDVGEIIERFTGQLEQAVPLRKTIEANIIASLSERDIQVKNIVLTKSFEDRYDVYITARVRRGRIVAADTLRKIVEKEMGVSLTLKEESRKIIGRSYEVICMHETPAFTCKTAVRRMSRFDDEVSGDNFYIGNIGNDQKVIIIADGMGNGKKAADESNELIDAIEELLMAGFDKDMSIRIVNSYLAEKSKGENFTTLDMLLIDLHTGYGVMYKQGAATTYIKRKDWMELVKSTSLPVGIIEGATCEKCSKKFFPGDLIVMVSDGVLESIVFENKDDYMQELLEGLSSDDPEDVVKEISDQIKAMSGNRLADDATVVVCKLVKTL